MAAIHYFYKRQEDEQNMVQSLLLQLIPKP